MDSSQVRAISSLNGTAYLLPARSGYILVDTLPKGSGLLLRRGLRKAGVPLRDIKLVLITHGHIDHFGNAVDISRATGAPLAIHELDAPAARLGMNMKLHSRNGFERFLARLVERLKVKPFEPDIMLTGEEGDLTKYGAEVNWVRTPGHTDGSISLVVPGSYAIVGDLVVGKYNLFKTPAYPLWVRDKGLLLDSIGRLLGYGPATILSGHGGPLRPADVRRTFMKSG